MCAPKFQPKQLSQARAPIRVVSLVAAVLYHAQAMALAILAPSVLLKGSSRIQTLSRSHFVVRSVSTSRRLFAVYATHHIAAPTWLGCGARSS